LKYYQLALQLYEVCWEDCEILMKDLRGRELARQLIKSVESIPSNIEEGYGRGMKKEYPYFLRVARGSGQESRGRYLRCKHLLSIELITVRVEMLGSIIGMVTKA